MPGFLCKPGCWGLIQLSLVFIGIAGDWGVLLAKALLLQTGKRDSVPGPPTSIPSSLADLLYHSSEVPLFVLVQYSCLVNQDTRRFI